MMLNLTFQALLAITVLFPVIAFLVYFYRDPEREVAENDNIIVSPADGKLVYLDRIENGAIRGIQDGKIELKNLTWIDLPIKDGYIFGIHMSPFDVHVNRSPINGKVVMIRSFKGKRLRLGNPRFRTLNRRNVIVIQHPKGFYVAIIQIAALIIGKIDCYVKEGDNVVIGQRIGRVHFGSHVDLIIPSMDNVKIKGVKGMKVLAGETILVENVF